MNAFFKGKIGPATLPKMKGVVKSFGAFKAYTNHKIRMEEIGITVSQEYDNLLHKCAYYISLLHTPNHNHLQYGDDSAGKADLEIMENICRWFEDEELAYIISGGICAVFIISQIRLYVNKILKKLTRGKGSV